ncbi:regulator of Vps4 activity in the MVB pathway-domain-containing protein, partial [Globomyces pollinis-pini]
MGFNPTKTKVQLKLSLNRLQLLQQKKTVQNQNIRREIGTLMKSGKLDSARIRVEHVIREDFLVEGLELLHLYCDTLLARYGLVANMTDLDPGITEAVYVIIYAAPRVDIQELTIIREQLVMKYGKELLENCNTNPDQFVNSRIIHKLSNHTPDPNLVQLYLKEIASAFGVDWNISQSKYSEPSSGDTAVKSTPNSDLEKSSSNPRDSITTINQSRQNSRYTPSAPEFVEPSSSQNSQPPDISEPDFDQLAKRFQSLKQKK